MAILCNFSVHTCIRPACLNVSLVLLPQRLSEIKGLSEAKVEKILEAAKKSCRGFGIQTAKDYEAQVLCLAVRRA